MTRTLVLLLSAPIWLAAAPQAAFSQAAAVSSLPTPQAVSIPDSVRKKVGDYRIEGLVMGGALGALAGLGLARTNDGGCVDCGDTESSLAIGAIIGGTLGGGLGFAIGAASSKYRWEQVPGP